MHVLANGDCGKSFPPHLHFLATLAPLPPALHGQLLGVHAASCCLPTLSLPSRARCALSLA
eukprot:10897992-Lingulodinium_polyedra.AAC.1